MLCSSWEGTHAYGSGESERKSPGREATGRAGPCPHSPPPCPHRPGGRQSAQSSPCAAGTGTWGERTGQVALGTDRDSQEGQEPPAWGKMPSQESPGATAQAESSPIESSFCTPKSTWKSSLNPQNEEEGRGSEAGAVQVGKEQQAVCVSTFPMAGSPPDPEAAVGVTGAAGHPAGPSPHPCPRCQSPPG